MTRALAALTLWTVAAVLCFSGSAAAMQRGPMEVTEVSQMVADGLSLARSGARFVGTGARRVWAWFTAPQRQLSPAEFFAVYRKQHPDGYHHDVLALQETYDSAVLALGFVRRQYRQHVDGPARSGPVHLDAEIQAQNEIKAAAIAKADKLAEHYSQVSSHYCDPACTLTEEQLKIVRGIKDAPEWFRNLWYEAPYDVDVRRNEARVMALLEEPAQAGHRVIRSESVHHA